MDVNGAGKSVSATKFQLYITANGQCYFRPRFWTPIHGSCRPFEAGTDISVFVDRRTIYWGITDLSALLPPGLALATKNQDSYLEEVNLRGEVMFVRGRVDGHGFPGRSIPVCLSGLSTYYGLQGT